MLSLIPLSSTTQSFEKGIRTVAYLGVICPRHIGFGLANTRVASGQRDPRIGTRFYQWILFIDRLDNASTRRACLGEYLTASTCLINSTRTRVYVSRMY